MGKRAERMREAEERQNRFDGGMLNPALREDLLPFP